MMSSEPIRTDRLSDAALAMETWVHPQHVCIPCQRAQGFPFLVCCEVGQNIMQLLPTDRVAEEPTSGSLMMYTYKFDL